MNIYLRIIIVPNILERASAIVATNQYHFGKHCTLQLQREKRYQNQTAMKRVRNRIRSERPYNHETNNQIPNRLSDINDRQGTARTDAWDRNETSRGIHLWSMTHTHTIETEPAPTPI